MPLWRGVCSKEQRWLRKLIDYASCGFACYLHGFLVLFSCSIIPDTEALRLCIKTESDDTGWMSGGSSFYILAPEPGKVRLRLPTIMRLEGRYCQTVGWSWLERSSDIPPPQSATLGLHPVARKLLLVSRPAKGRRLSWPEHTVG